MSADIYTGSNIISIDTEMFDLVDLVLVLFLDIHVLD